MGTTGSVETEKLAAWAAANPRIRRVWLWGSDTKRGASTGTDVDVAIELEPVADSEETISYWIAHAEEWQAELENCVGSSVDLEWFDPDVDAPLGDKAVLVYDRLDPVRPQRPSSADPRPPR